MNFEKSNFFFGLNPWKSEASGGGWLVLLNVSDLGLLLGGGNSSSCANRVFATSIKAGIKRNIFFTVIDWIRLNEIEGKLFYTKQAFVIVKLRKEQ